MRGGSTAGAWKAVRALEGMYLSVAPTVAAEGEAVAAMIARLRIAACRTAIKQSWRDPFNLARITAILEHLGVPLLYLGDLFERSEIRDLLSLIGLGVNLAMSDWRALRTAGISGIEE